MVISTAGAIVLVPFPFSDLSQSKLRPAVALADAGKGDWILCQITSNPYGDERAIAIVDDSLRSGQLRMTSYARPGKLFTADTDIVVGEVGVLTEERLNSIIDAVVILLRREVRQKRRT